MILRLLDKLIFAVTLVLALQVPQLADHYHQFLSGLYQSTKWQVDGYEATARQYEYPDTNAMIGHHLQNNVASVRADAEQKLATLAIYEQLQDGMLVFKSGNLLKKAVYMFNPARLDYLKAALNNFKPGIPLSLDGLMFGLLLGLLLNYIAILPFMFLARRKNA